MKHLIKTYSVADIDNQRLSKEIYSCRGVPSVIKSNEGGYHTHEDLHLIAGGEIEQLTLRIARTLEHKYIFEDMWAIINKTGDSNIIHNHGEEDDDEDISLAYYVSANQWSGDIVFYQDSGGVEEIDRIVPKTGLLVVFPSWMEHGVEENKSKHRRIVISANMRLSS